MNSLNLRFAGEGASPVDESADMPSPTPTTTVPAPRDPWGADEAQASWHFFSAQDETDNYANQKALFLSFYQLAADKEVNFKAFVTNFNQSFAVQYGEEQVFGRNDPIMTFKNTTRKMNVAFEIPAATIQEAKHNLARVNLLAQFMYPAYLQENRANTIAKPPLLRVAFANLVRRSMMGGSPSAKLAGVLCTVTSLNISPSFDDEGFFDEGTATLYPKLIRVDMDFTVLHERDLGWDAAGSEGTFGFNGPGEARVYPFGEVSPREGRLTLNESPTIPPTAPAGAAGDADDLSLPGAQTQIAPDDGSDPDAAESEAAGSEPFNSLGLRSSGNRRAGSARRRSPDTDTSSLPSRSR
tara:strand:+ start:159 stop:1220 length:1062 start_codon:yes stop_codon:yes gene_type:complete